jgi:hypothetical protein
MPESSEPPVSIKALDSGVQLSAVCVAIAAGSADA